MKDNLTISAKNLPVKLPVFPTILIVLCLDYWNAPEWGWAVAITLLVILWIIVIIAKVKQNEIDVFESKGLLP